MKLINLGILLSCMILVAIGAAVYASNSQMFGLAAGVALVFQVGAIACFLMDNSTLAVESEKRDVQPEKANGNPIDLDAS